MQIREVLSHQAQLHPWIPFYKQTINEDGQLRETHCILKKNLKSIRYK